MDIGNKETYTTLNPLSVKLNWLGFDPYGPYNMEDSPENMVKGMVKVIDSATDPKMIDLLVEIWNELGRTWTV